MLTTNREDAFDLLQDTTLRALDNQEKYVNDNNFSAWTVTIMRNIFINNYRKEILNQNYFDTSADYYQLNLLQNSGYSSPEDIYMEKEINAAIRQLEPFVKIPFCLCLEGYTYDEISEKMEVPIGTVKSRISIARQELQRKLEGAQ
ncbi:RNA polymerase sigma factor [Bacteroidia bacterium]|nr:RNA polymerase sigma factor [Bacteroidia bacterium]